MPHSTVRPLRFDRMTRIPTHELQLRSTMLSIAPSKSAAFTLIELMIGLALVGILLAIAAPNWRGFLATAELRDSSGSLARALGVARSEAIKRATRVDLCPSTDRIYCARAGTWETGW